MELVGGEGELYEQFRFRLTRAMDRALEKAAFKEGRFHRSKAAIVRDSLRFALGGAIAEAPFGTLLKIAREEAGLNYPQLAEAADIDAGSLWRFENGRDPRLSSLQKLAKALGVTIVVDAEGGVALLRRQA
jgi:ribosome-binding protein aMBF1 (putative translation factor)